MEKINKGKRKILFVRPDYHSTFFLVKQLHYLGWNASIFIDQSYPKKLLYSKKYICGLKHFNGNNIFLKAINYISQVLQYYYLIMFYDYIIYYSKIPLFSRLDKFLSFGYKHFSFELFFIRRILKKKIIYLPSGCREELFKRDYIKIDSNICSNCGYETKCNDKINNQLFDRLNKYSNLNYGSGFLEFTRYKNKVFKFKSIDLKLWSKNLVIPNKHQFEKNRSIKILHSHFLNQSQRNENKKNIKGTPHIEKAIDKLINEGYGIEKIILEDIPSNEMRFYQAQADIVVDQLIFGQWGSTAIECMALSKPVICYLNPVFKNNFLTNFPEYDDLPIVEANTSTIYEVLKELIENSELRKQIGMRSRNFVERHYDPEKNAKILIEQLSALD